MPPRSVRSLDAAGKRVLVRVDFNVPLRDGKVSDDSRIAAALPTISYLMESRARVILCSHLGRPGGEVVEAERLAPVVQRLQELLGAEVAYARDCIGAKAQRAVDALGDGQVLVLENLRFHSGEEENSPEFTRELAALGEAFVNDAFGAAHRAHASIVGVTRYLPSAAGFLLEREVDALGRILSSQERPFAAVLGGAKVSDKIGVLENLLGKLDLLLVGGGMAATFLKAQGHEVGDSLVEEERIEFAGTVLADASASGVRLLLPEDVVVAREFSADSPTETVPALAVPSGWRIMDVGPRTVVRFREALQGCATVLWNGPMGVFEFPAFAQATRELAQAIASLKDAVTVVGGGSTAEAVMELGLAPGMTHVSTGGGASLEFLEGRELPGVAALLTGEGAGA